MKRLGSRRTIGHGPLPALLVLAALSPPTIRAQPPAAGVVGGGVGDPAGASTPSKTRKVADLASRYRFSERYTLQDEQVAPGVVGPYRVAISEALKDSVDNPRGAPKRAEVTRQVVYTERPVEIGSLGTAASVTRTFERSLVKPEDSSRTMGPRPLQGLSIFVRPKLGELPVVASLVDGRQLTEYEYDVAARQVFVSQLAALLPSQVVRVGDSWRVARKAAQALLGDPSLQGDTLTGRLIEVRKEVDGPRMVASIGLAGKVTGALGETTVNAEVLFTFVPSPSSRAPAPRPGSVPRPDEEITEARGAITEFRLARVTGGPLPGAGRLRFRSSREVTLHRQVGLVAGAVSPPKLEKPPELTEDNAWLTHVDGDGRYAFRHPQDLLPPDRSEVQAEPNTSLLIRSRREGRDMLQVEYAAKVLTPQDLKKELAEKYGMTKMDVIKGDEAWLPEADWPKMRVHRVDAEVKVGEANATPATGSTRLHFDGYLIQFGQSASILAIAYTTRVGVGGYRQEVEKILKSIRLDPPRPAVK